jgi:hypothetical protein
MVPLPGHWDDGGIDVGRFWPRVQEVLAAEAGVPLPSVRIEDPDRRPPPGRAGPVAGDDHLRSLADHIPPETDPRLASQLEADPGRLADGGGHARDEAGRLQDDEGDPGPSSQGGEPAEAVGDAGGTLDPPGQVDDEEVHGPPGEERAGDREAFIGIRRGEDHEPLRPDAASDRLHGIQGRGEVHPGHDGARCLGLRDQPQGERRPPAREVAPERQAHPARQATGPEDRVERCEPGRQNPCRISLRGLIRCLGRPVIGSRERHHRERSDDLADPARRGGAPLRPKGRQGRRDIGGKRRHELSIEHLFE